MPEATLAIKRLTALQESIAQWIEEQRAGYWEEGGHGSPPLDALCRVF